MRLYYTLKTIDPIIVSENNSTENNDACLDYIPGSAILGALASKHYVALSEQDSWKLFHTGECVFSHCYPLVNHQLALPTPASWHFLKGKNAVDSTGKYNANEISNHASVSFERQEGVQYKQCRDGYINSDAQSAMVKQGLTTKTAIDNQTGGAKESQLFSYSYIQPAQTFLGWIDCDDGVLLNALKATLKNGLLVGRSRHSEFGRVAIDVVESPVIAEPTNNENTLVIWCLSDCECLDELGNPTFTPTLQSLNSLLKGHLNKQKSYIRSTSCSRFNQKRGGLDSEQILISKGSVLVYDLDQKAEQAVINTLNEVGIGLNKQQGLGWVSVNPAWAFKPSLSNDELLFTPVIIKAGVDKKDKVATTSALLSWVAEKLSEDTKSIARKQAVNSLLKLIVQAYQDARRYNNILNSNEVGPSSSQWRRISTLIRTKESHWASAVFEGENAICKSDNDRLGWGISWSSAKGNTDFSVFTKDLLSGLNVTEMRQLLEKLNRYDLSTYKGLHKMVNELGLTSGDSHD
ncbi:hypothetical protein [uncultured Psychromonas sp.]|uniref:hypothetical protein n=1 Tax=uncultured Psychromonas sp. TaxID=173974 RepID=UPI002632D50B|nr:hypothetical protein [uncultured Psychromonas sp.]